MFVPVACPKCSKPFQVSDADAGREVLCPWCQASVAALPVAAPVAHAPGSPNPGSPELAPLSLDEAPPSSPLPAAPTTETAPPFRFPYRRVIVAVLLVALVFTLTVVFLGHG